MNRPRIAESSSARNPSPDALMAIAAVFVVLVLVGILALTGLLQ